MRILDRLIFAIWSFEYDRLCGIYTKESMFKDLSAEDKADYLSEADYHLSSENVELPQDIIERAIKEGYELD